MAINSYLAIYRNSNKTTCRVMGSLTGKGWGLHGEGELGRRQGSQRNSPSLSVGKLQLLVQPELLEFVTSYLKGTQLCVCCYCCSSWFIPKKSVLAKVIAILQRCNLKRVCLRTSDVHTRGVTRSMTTDDCITAPAVRKDETRTYHLAPTSGNSW